jgi:hypothetical protein
MMLIAAPAAFAQNPETPAEPAEVETLVVTGSRTPLPVESVPASVTVITREDIERGAYTSLVDVMRHIPGIHLEEAGSRGGRASLYTRGLDPNHTVVMIDGVRINDPTNDRGGSFDFSTLDPASIERIEIVRGPVSAVYGSDAIAGAVNIITRRGDAEPAVTLDASGGRWGVYRIAGEARGEHGPFDMAVGGGWVDEGEPPGKGRFHGGNVKANLGLELPGGGEIRSALRWSDTHSEAFPDDSGGPDLAVIRQRRRARFGRTQRESRIHEQADRVARDFAARWLLPEAQSHRLARHRLGQARPDPVGAHQGPLRLRRPGAVGDGASVGEPLADGRW